MVLSMLTGLLTGNLRLVAAAVAAVVFLVLMSGAPVSRTPDSSEKDMDGVSS